MTKIAYPLTLLSVMLACSLLTAPAHARARVFVASYGNDANPCTFGSPCKTFQQAVNVVDTGGEVTAIDSAGFGPISITKAVTIISPAGVEAGIVPAAGEDAIDISASASSVVTLHGLTIDGGGGGVTGISMTQAATLVIVNCIVRNFTSSGIALGPTSASNITVSDTIVADNGGHGVYLQPNTTVGPGIQVHATFNRIQALNNAQRGIGIFSNFTVNSFDAIAVDGVASGNQTGFYAFGNRATLHAFRSTTIGNGDGMRAENGGLITVSQSNLESDGWSTDGKGVVQSYGDNYTNNALPPGQTLGRD